MSDLKLERMSWYAIRSVYRFGSKSDGTNVFEERVVCFGAESSEQAHSKARIESQAYAEQGRYEAHYEQVGYEQDGEMLIDGYELWSELYESTLSLEEFYARRYSEFIYKPELPHVSASE